jgi:hypothetical protein
MNKYTQKNGMEIEEGRLYLTVVGDLVRVETINLNENKLICKNITDSCKSHHRLDAAIKDNKFTILKF